MITFLAVVPVLGLSLSPTPGLYSPQEEWRGALDTEWEITLKGVAGESVRNALSEFHLETREEQTVLGAELPDQAALHGLLDRIRDLGVEILEVRSIQHR
jgi:hypothetical protein